MNKINLPEDIFSLKTISVITNLVKSINEPIGINHLFEICPIYHRSYTSSTCAIFTFIKLSDNECRLESIGFYMGKTSVDIFAEAKYHNREIKVIKGNKYLIESTLSRWERCIQRRIKLNTKYQIPNTLCYLH